MTDISLKGLEHPEPGDHWTEVGQAVCTVLEVGDDSIVLLARNDDKHTIETTTREEFRTRFLYGPNSKRTWALLTGKRMSYVEDYLKTKGGARGSRKS